jgi:phage I-like protein
MPYTLDNPPDEIKNQPKHLIAIWVAVYNSAFEQYNGDEAQSRATAWAAVKEKFQKNDKTGMWEPKATMHKAILTWEVHGGVPEWIRILPAGKVKLTDDRPPFLVDSRAMTDIVGAFEVRGNDLVIDYEHQTMDGVQAPAAGWIKNLDPRDDGLWAKVEWTDKALGYISSREYRYFSPVVTIDPETRRVKELLHAALTNFPAIANLTPLAAKYGALEVLTLAADAQAKKAQEERSRKYGIGIKEKGNVTKPGEFSSVADDMFADPVNYRYPLDNYDHVRAAWGYWNQTGNQDQYDQAEVTKITNKIKSRAKAVGMKISEKHAREVFMIETLRKILSLPDDADESTVILKVQESHKGAVSIPDLEKKATEAEAAVLVAKEAAKKAELRATELELKANKMKVPLLITEVIGLPADSPVEKVITRIEGLKSEIESGKEARINLAKVQEEVKKEKAEALIQEALKTGRTSPEELSRSDNRLQRMATEDPQFFKDLILARATYSVVPLEKLDLKKETGDKDGVLSESAIKMCAAMGLTPDKFKESQAGLAERKAKNQ